MKKSLFLFLLLSLFLSVAAQSNGTLTVTTTTISPTKVVKSRHVLAFWIEDSNGKMVNSMFYYNGPNVNQEGADLTEWWLQIGRLYINKNAMTNVDAITSATVGIHTVRTAYWGKTVPLSSVPDGEYTVKMEMAVGVSGDGLSGYAIKDFKFTKGPSNSQGLLTRSISRYIPDFNTGLFRDTIDCFTKTTINWVPVPTALDKVAYDNLFAVYPNPCKSTVFVNGVDIKQLEVLSMDNKLLLKFNQPNINLAGLHPGTYLLRIFTINGIVVKKIVKE